MPLIVLIKLQAKTVKCFIPLVYSYLYCITFRRQYNYQLVHARIYITFLDDIEPLIISDSSYVYKQLMGLSVLYNVVLDVS